MPRKIIVAMMMMGISGMAFAGGMDDSLRYEVSIDQLEFRQTHGANPLVWKADAWIGKDLHKFLFKTEGERADGEIGELETQFLYSRAMTPSWDLQVGWRHDVKPKPTRDWLVIGFEGLAPYGIETETGLFIGESGQLGFGLEAEYEYRLTQRLVLSPEIEVSLHGKDDEDTGIGSGFSDLELGLRLGYEIQREFVPYIGVNWTKMFGETADFARDEGEDTNDIQIVTGIRVLF
ncbi:MAG: copper resistance protein B [Gammaproteobacteria bacterium]|nr:copper resistance protein B [Gammaproteobacteria bacterium]